MRERILLDAGPSPYSGHKWEKARVCPQLYAYQAELGITFPPTPPLIRGSLLHVGLAHAYRREQARQHADDPDQWYEPEEAVCRLATTFEDGFHYAEGICAALRHYLEIRPMPREIVLVERVVLARITVKRPERRVEPYSQRIDLAVREKEQVWIWDHKSASKPGKNTIEGLALSGQVLGLWHLGARLWGEKFGGVILNVIGIEPPYKVVRAPAPIAPHALEDYVPSLRDGVERVLTLKAEGRDPWRYPKTLSDSNACRGLYGPCDAWELCRWGKPS